MVIGVTRRGNLRLISYRIISYRIISYQIRSYHIISHTTERQTAVCGISTPSRLFLFFFPARVTNYLYTRFLYIYIYIYIYSRSVFLDIATHTHTHTHTHTTHTDRQTDRNNRHELAIILFIVLLLRSDAVGGCAATVGR